jgi:D-alanyl-D-alanine dipeptidase
MGWGRGLHASEAAGPRKREGDGRAPAGVFPLKQAFGAADALPTNSHGFPYLKSLPTSYCVEDVRSQHYNRIVDSARISPSSWEQWSPLLRSDGLFNWGIVVEQNAPEIRKASGSCVFLHIWRGPHQPTAGCTSMSEQTLEEIIRWLDAKLDPVLVQLPDPVLEKLRQTWGLP